MTLIRSVSGLSGPPTFHPISRGEADARIRLAGRADFWVVQLGEGIHQKPPFLAGHDGRPPIDIANANRLGSLPL